MLLLLTLLLASAPEVHVGVEVKKPLKLNKRGELTGVLEVRVTNRGADPVTLRHLDVHAFRFVPVSGDGGTQVLFHSCDCGFELGVDPPPASRTFTLRGGEQRVITFDDFTCGGGPFKPPPPGKYQVSWAVGEASASEPAPSPAKFDLKRCDTLVRSRPPEAFESTPVSVELRR